MASISNIPTPNPQLTGITGALPMPTGGTTNPDGTRFQLGQGVVGGSSGPNFAIVPDTVGTPTASGATGQVVVGGGTAAPANGAQPPVPGTTAGGLPPAVSTTTVTPTPTNTGVTAAAPAAAATTTTTAATASASTVSGFGKAERSAQMTAGVGEAKFSFPSFKTSAKSNSAPAITWGPDWKRVQGNGMFYMEHPNGTKAIPATEFRVTPTPADKVQTVKVANGWGKKFPDGSIVVFDRNEGAYRLDAKGNKHALALGTHTIGGVKVRVFEAAVVRTLEPSGVVNVFTSRGQHTPGTTRGRIGAALGAASAGAAATGGGAAPGKAPSTQVPGTAVAGAGGAPSTDMVRNVEQLTAAARGILDQIRSGSVDPAKLAELQAQLGKLPAGILQAAAAAGTMTSDGRTAHPAHGGAHAAATSPATAPGTPPAPGSTVAGTSGGGAAPVAGADANSPTVTIAATKAFAITELPKELHGKQARFGQLPPAVQDAIAARLGSDQGSGALKADQLVAFTADGANFTLPGGATAYVRHQAQVRGAGPGEDLAMTVRPARQPGDARPSATASTTGGGATSKPAQAATSPASGGGTVTSNHGTHVSGSGVPGTPRPIGARPVVTVGGGAPSTANKIRLFAPGASMRSIDFGGLNGSFTWKTLPKRAQDAILTHLRTEVSDPAAKAFATRSGSGWTFDPNAVIVLDAGFASFMGGLTMSKGTAPRPAAAAAGGGAPSSGGATGASTRPPVSGGGASPSGVGSVSPGTAPPAPVIPGGAGHGAGHGVHAH